MGIIIKQSIRSSIFSYIGVVIGYINVLWLYPFFLEADQIGLFRIIQSSAYLLATFGQFGMGSTLVKFFPQYKKEKGLLGFAMLASSIGYLVLLGFCLLFKGSITSYFAKESALFVEYFQILLIITFLLIQFQVLEAYCRSILDIAMPTFLRDIGIRIFTTLFVILYAFDYLNFDQLVWSFAATFLLMSLALLVYLATKKKASFSMNFSFLDKTSLRKMLNFGAYALLGAGGTQIILQIDSIMVSGALGLDETGIYTIAFFIGTVIELPKRAIAQLSMSLLSQNFKNNDMAAVKKLYQQTSINQFIIGALLLLGIWSNLESVYHFVPNGALYQQGFYVVLFIGLGKLSDMLFGANGEIIVMSKYYRFNVLSVLILALLTIVLNLYLIPVYGIRGAALASFLAMFSFNLIKYLFVWIKFRIQPFSKKTFLAFLITALVYVGQLQLPSFDLPLVDLIIRSSLIGIIFLGLMIGLKISPEINGLFFRSLRMIKLIK